MKVTRPLSCLHALYINQYNLRPILKMLTTPTTLLTLFLVITAVTYSARVPGEVSKQKCEYYYRKFGERPNPVLSATHSSNLPDKSCKGGTPLVSKGEDATDAEFPHMARLGYLDHKHNDSVEWLCGGSLISEKHVLTAAHCIVDNADSTLKYVQFGAQMFNDTPETNSFLQIIEIERGIRHEEYREGSLHNDVGIVELKHAPSFPTRLSHKQMIRIKPACLQADPDYSRLNRVIISGWGNLNDKFEKFATKLQKATLELANRTLCLENFATAIQKQDILKDGISETTQFCAGTQEGQDACRGDSGGPLQVYRVDDSTRCMYNIVGVVSGGKFCNEKTVLRLGIYTKVAYYIKWIEDKVWPETIQ